jgi:hypothetical protein
MSGETPGTEQIRGTQAETSEEAVYFAWNGGLPVDTHDDSEEEEEEEED